MGSPQWFGLLIGLLMVLFLIVFLVGLSELSMWLNADMRLVFPGGLITALTLFIITAVLTKYFLP